MLRIAPAVLLIFFMTGCASNQPDTDQQHSVLADNTPVNNAVPVESERVSDDSEVVCRRVRETGSHIPKKVCKTRAQIERERAANADALTRTKLTPVGSLTEGGP